LRILASDCDIFYGSITQKNMCIYSNKLMSTLRKNNKKVTYLLQDLTKKLDISIFNSADTIKYNIENSTDEDIKYINKYIIWPIIKNLNDIMIHNHIKINNYDEFIEKYTNNIISRDDFINLTITFLTKYLYKMYDIMLDSEFYHNYCKGLIGIPLK